MSPAELHQMEMRWYATFWDERDQQLDRVQVGDGKIAIPLYAMYMTFDAEVKSVPMTPVTHMCPPDEGGMLACCGLTPFEVPRTDKITADLKLVTCQGL